MEKPKMVEMELYQELLEKRNKLEAELEDMIEKGNFWEEQHQREVAELRDLLNKVYAERDNARDDAEALREELEAWKSL